MTENMQTVRFHAGNDGARTLHIELDGGIVNITVGLTDGEGRAVFTVGILPDDETRGGDANGRIWKLADDGCRVIRQPSEVGEVAISEAATGGWWSLTTSGIQPDDDELERIGGMVAEGYTSGEIIDPSPAEHWHIGSNVPGYLPESDVHCAGDDAEMAREILLDELRRDQEGLPICEQPGRDNVSCGTCPGCVAYAQIQELVDHPERVDAEIEANDGFSVAVSDGRALPVNYWVTKVNRNDCDIDNDE